MIESGCVHLCLFCFRTYWMCPCNSIFVSQQPHTSSAGLNIELDVLLLLKLYSVRLISSLRIICASLLFNVFMKTEKKTFHFYFYFTFSCPSNCSPTLHSTHSKSPRQPDAANCWETAAAQGCPLASDRQRLPNTSRPERNKSAACLTWRRTCVVCHFSFRAAAGGDFFCVFLRMRLSPLLLTVLKIHPSLCSPL